MGVRKLKKFLTQVIPENNGIRYFNSVKEFVKTESMRLYGDENHKLVVAIDTSNYMAKYRPHSESMEPAFFKQIMLSIHSGLYPIYVFDGKAPLSKENTIKRRQRIIEKNNNELNELRAKMQDYPFKTANEKANEIVNTNIDWNNDWNDNETVCESTEAEMSDNSQESGWESPSDHRISLDVDETMSQSFGSPSGSPPTPGLFLSSINNLAFDPAMIDDNSNEYYSLLKEIEKKKKKTRKPSISDAINLKNFLDFLHIPYVTAHGEAENLIAQMYKEGIIHVCLSEDTDTLPKGCGNLIQIGITDLKFKVTQFILSEILIQLNLSYEQFVDFCIILGTDYYSNHSLGIDDPRKAYETFIKYPSITAFLDYHDKAEYLEPLISARNEFLTTGEELGDEVYGFTPCNPYYYRSFELKQIYEYFNNNGVIYDTVFQSWCSELFRSRRR